MQKYVCTICGYIYDPKEGDPDGLLNYAGMGPVQREEPSGTGNQGISQGLHTINDSVVA